MASTVAPATWWSWTAGSGDEPAPVAEWPIEAATDRVVASVFSLPEKLIAAGGPTTGAAWIKVDCEVAIAGEFEQWDADVGIFLENSYGASVHEYYDYPETGTSRVVGYFEGVPLDGIETVAVYLNHARVADMSLQITLTVSDSPIEDDPDPGPDPDPVERNWVNVFDAGPCRVEVYQSGTLVPESEWASHQIHSVEVLSDGTVRVDGEGLSGYQIVVRPEFPTGGRAVRVLDMEVERDSVWVLNLDGVSVRGETEFWQPLDSDSGNPVMRYSPDPVTAESPPADWDWVSVNIEVGG